MGTHELYRDKKHRPKITKEGYRQVYEPTNSHARKNGYALEHIVIVEKKLHRKINLKIEFVYHINGNLLDNRKSNLKVMLRKDYYKIYNF